MHSCSYTGRILWITNKNPNTLYIKITIVTKLLFWYFLIETDYVPEIFVCWYFAMYHFIVLLCMYHWIVNKLEMNLIKTYMYSPFIFKPWFVTNMYIVLLNKKVKKYKMAAIDHLEILLDKQRYTHFATIYHNMLKA